MQIKSYFTTPIKVKSLLSTENDMNIPEYSSERVVMARADGTAGLRFAGNSIIKATDYIYLVGEPFELGDFVNGMPVKNVEPIYEFNGEISHYELVVGPT